MAKLYNSSAPIPNTAGTTPLPRSAAQTFQGDPTGGIGQALAGIGQDMQRIRMANEEAEGLAAYNQKVNQYMLSLETKDPRKEDFIEGFRGLDFDEIYEGKSKAVRQRLRNKFQTENSIREAQISRKAFGMEVALTKQETLPLLYNLAENGQIQEGYDLIEESKGLWPEALRNDVIAEYEQIIEETTEKAAQNMAWRAMQDVATKAGWTSAVEWLNDPGNQQGLSQDQVSDLTRDAKLQAGVAKDRHNRQWNERKSQYFIEADRMLQEGTLTPEAINDTSSFGPFVGTEGEEVVRIQESFRKRLEDKNTGKSIISDPFVESRLKLQAARVGNDPGDIASFTDEVRQLREEEKIDDSAVSRILGDMNQSAISEREATISNVDQTARYAIISVGSGEAVDPMVAFRQAFEGGEGLDSAKDKARVRQLERLTYQRYNMWLTDFAKNNPEMNRSQFQEEAIRTLFQEYAGKTPDEMEADLTEYQKRLMRDFEQDISQQGAFQYEPEPGSVGELKYPVMQSPEEAEKLPPGTRFFDSNGTLRIRK